MKETILISIITPKKGIVILIATIWIAILTIIATTVLVILLGQISLTILTRIISSGKWIIMNPRAGLNKEETITLELKLGGSGLRIIKRFISPALS